MVSIDGYRFDYNKKYNAPHLSRFFKDGTWSKALIPVFPSLTFPNHYSIITGLRPGNHGIVANQFWDPQRKEMYHFAKPKALDGSWYGGKPIWVAAGEQGMLSASYFWVGSDVKIQGRYPTYYYPYNKKTPNLERVNQVLKWLQFPPKKRPHFITLYFSDVDTAGHKFSPDSKEVGESIQEIDQVLGALFKAVEKNSLPINIIVLSDHGMESYDKYLYLTDYISLEGIRVAERGAIMLLYIEDTERVHLIQEKLQKVNPIKAYRPEELPKKYKYLHSRVGDLVLIMTPGYYLYPTRASEKSRSSESRGIHGYEVRASVNMNGVFFAKGPNIKALGEIEAFENIEVYPLIMDLLGFEIRAPIDGRRKFLSNRLLMLEK